MARLWQFRHDWVVAAEPDDAYAVCADVDAYHALMMQSCERGMAAALG